MRKIPDAMARLTEMVKLYRKCYDITRKAAAGESLQDDNLLAEVLDQRAELLARISDIEQGLDTDNQSGQKIILGIPPQQMDAAGLLIRDLDHSMRELLKADGALHSKIATELVDLEGNLTRLRRGHSALKGYAPFRVGSPRCIDRKS